jgi:choice-of-anchor A domain-containing protein
MRAKRKLSLFTIVPAIFGMALSSSFASGFDLGQAGGYSAFILPGGSLNMPINGGASVVGDVAASAGTHIDLGANSKVGPLAGTDQVVGGRIFLDTISDPANPATVKLQHQDPNSVFSRDLTQGVADAFALNQSVAGLSPTQTFTGTLEVKGATPFTIDSTAPGGMNVISLDTLKVDGGGNLILNGSASDFFIFNITGNYTQSGGSPVTLSGGITPDHVLWNFVGGPFGAGANIGGASDAVGVFLAPFRDFSITDSTLNGSIITAGDLKITSQALVVPEIPTTSALLIGFGFLAGALRLRRRPLLQRSRSR